MYTQLIAFRLDTKYKSIFRPSLFILQSSLLALMRVDVDDECNAEIEEFAPDSFPGSGESDEYLAPVASPSPPQNMPPQASTQRRPSETHTYPTDRNENRQAFQKLMKQQNDAMLVRKF